MNNDGKKVAAENYSTLSMAHKGICYRCGKHGPANAEEHMAKEAGRQLLFKKDGSYRGDDTAVAVVKIFADNDCRAPRNFIKEQNVIIGEELDGVAEHYQDTNHCMKNLSNAMYDIRKSDPSLNGVGMLENKRIRSICSDVRKSIAAYHLHIGDETERNRCLDQMYCIIPHHCGDHSHCTNVQYCRYLSVKTAHTDDDWTEEQVKAEVAESSLRFGGNHMDLSEVGQKSLMKIIGKRFCAANIDRIAEMGDSNSCEGFWGTTVKFTEGKRLNLDQTDYWKSILDFCYCRAGGNIERTMLQLSDQLCVPVNSVQTKSNAETKRKRISDVKRNNGERAKLRRERSKLMKGVKMAKEDAKSTRYKPEKVSLKESAKSSVKAKSTNTKKQKRCSKCKQEHHTAGKCLMPALNKRGRKKREEFVDWYTEYHPDVEEKAKKMMRYTTKEPEYLNWD